jgi:hypothetical protein
LLEIAEWAASEKFEMLEVCCWPKSSGVNRRYADITHIELEDFIILVRMFLCFCFLLFLRI